MLFNIFSFLFAMIFLINLVSVIDDEPQVAWMFNAIAIIIGVMQFGGVAIVLSYLVYMSFVFIMYIFDMPKFVDIEDAIITFFLTIPFALIPILNMWVTIEFFKEKVK